MHRVELKVLVFSIGMNVAYGLVPNAPCGVERFRLVSWLVACIGWAVPNAPCGVES